MENVIENKIEEIKIENKKIKLKMNNRIENEIENEIENSIENKTNLIRKCPNLFLSILRYLVGRVDPIFDTCPKFRSFIF